MSLFRHTASLLRRTESLQAALTAAAFWTLAAIALAGLRDLHLWGMPQVVGVTARATMACVIVLAGMAGIRCLADWPKSGLRASVLGAIGGMPGLLLIGAVASYLAIGVAVMDDADWTPDMAATVRYAVLCLGVLVAAAVGGRAMSERVGADRLLRGVLVVLIGCCAVILASPVLRDLGVLAPYRLPFRLTGAFTEPNNAGLVACMTAALAAALLTNGGPRRLGWLGLAAGVAAALGTASRTALVVLGALAVLFLLLNLRSRPRALVPVAAGVVLAGIAGFVGLVGFSGGFSEWSRLRYDSAQEGNLLCDPSPTDRRDCAVLLAVRDMLAGDIALNWSRTRPVERWQGVTTAGPEERVTGLRLAGLGLNGRIPPELGRLDRLELLSLQRNRLTGGIPPELGDLANLKQLNLSFNALTGAVPPELAKLRDLSRLRLNHNRLTGPLPVALGDLRLSVLRLGGNDFDSVPPGLAAADSDLAGAQPCLPPAPMNRALLDDCTALLAAKEALAGGAALNWHAQLPVGNWQGVTAGGPEGSVTGLNLYGRGLNGRIPPELGRLKRLRTLNLARNRLTGPIPPELGQLTDLRELALDRNALTGAVPAELGQLPRLASLWLRENRFTGPVPSVLFDVPEHDLGHFLYCLPPPAPGLPVFDDCALLLAVKDTLAGDALLNWGATLPVGLWQGVTLGGPQGRVAGLDLHGKGLDGRIPPQLGKLEGLEWLNLAGNRLTGPIPPQLGKLEGLEWLNLADNRLTGPIPLELETLARLDGLLLGGNSLDGPVPPPLLDIPEHDLGHLLFCLPPLLAGSALLEDCERLLAARGALAGDARLNWSRALPMGEWQGVTVGGPQGRVVALELPRMRLNGRIPAALGGLAGLQALELDANALTGAIPPELGKLTDLETLGLAVNALTGPVPPELEQLPGLRELRLDGNRLTGSLPPGLQAATGGAVSCAAAPADNPALRADCAVLLAARDILAGDARLNWSEHVPIDSWQGLTLDGSPKRVTRLELFGLDLSGRIPSELGRLSRLVMLNLSRNRLTGGIPPALGGLDKLESLFLRRNRLIGPVPPELGALSALERLVLSLNALSGPIPPELGKLPHLRELWLKDNRLSGPAPPELQGLDDLVVLRLSGNDLDRPYPRRLFRVTDHDLFRDGLRRGQPRGDAGAAETAGRRETESGPVCRPGSGGASGLDADCGLLLANRDVLAGSAPLNWSEQVPIDFWQGVTVGGSPKRVTALELPRAGLDGRLFATLGELTGLVALDLSHNRLTGPAPPELERLDKLAFLRLAGNNLDRPFPPALRRIADHDLDMPDFCRPQAVGPGLLADCALLLSARDTLAGDAPLNWRRDAPVDDWQGVTVDRSRGRVAALDLTQMGLNGRIPAELGRLAGLVSLRLSRNRLAGGIPPELGKLAGLRELALDGNLLTGPAPPEFGKLSKLIDLRLNDNPLTGPASGRGPDLLCRSSLEKRLHDDCALLLEIRDELAGEVELNWSEAVPINYWRGVAIGLPAATGEAGQRTRVIALDLSHMGLNGRIPARLAALDALAVLRLGDNRLAGPIPPELGALAGLRTLTLENNALTGNIPPELGALKALVSLRLGGNALAGRTRQFTALANLRVLALENNMLTGNIHPRLGGLKHLEELRLENNRLHGTIPGKLGRLSRLAVLRLGGNVLTGCVPAASRVARVRRNDLASAGLLCEAPPWSKPGLFDGGARLMRLRDILAGDAALDWSYDRPVASWEGVTIGNSGRVAALDLRDRNLTGRIPAELGELGHLRVLRLDGNRLTGPIPPELGKLTRLAMLSLEGNRLTGPVPPEVANLPNLRQLWLADNRLTGSIPFEWARVRGVSLAVAGNDLDSCTAWELRRLRSSDIDHGTVCTFFMNRRPFLWRLGFEKAMEAPVFGHGFWALKYLEGAPLTHSGLLPDPHNLYINLLGEAGIVPLLLFLSAIVLLLRTQWVAPKSLARDTTVAWVIVIVLYCMTFAHLFGNKAFMLMAGLSVAIGAVRNAGDRRPAKA